MIQALMIDVDGVLITGRPSDGGHWAADLEADLGLSFAILQEAFFSPHWDDIVTGRTRLRERLTPVLPEIAPALTTDRLIEYWFAQDARLNHRLLDELAVIRHAGLRVDLATNQEHERARYLMNVVGLAAHVDECHYSAALGYRKPTRGFFDAVARRVGLPPDELLLVDDAEENVQAAIAAGWRAAQWTGRERLHELVARASRRAVMG